MSYIDLASEHIAEQYPLIVYGKPALSELPVGSIIGTWAYSVPTKVKFILDRGYELAPGVLPADVSRAWIRTEYDLPLRRKKNQLVRSYKVPVHAIVGNHGECSYVDIRAAYLHILSLGYDVEYRFKHYIASDPHKVPEEIAKHKMCYAIAIAMSGSILSSIEIKGNNGFFQHKPMNMYSNPCLYNLAQDTLNAIGAEVLSVLGNKCVYMNTDGFIVKAGYERYVEDIITTWGFSSRVKHSGDTEVRGVGSWKVGDEHTKRWDARAGNFTNTPL